MDSDARQRFSPPAWEQIQKARDALGHGRSGVQHLLKIYDVGTPADIDQLNTALLAVREAYADVPRTSAEIARFLHRHAVVRDTARRYSGSLAEMSSPAPTAPDEPPAARGTSRPGPRHPARLGRDAPVPIDQSLGTPPADRAPVPSARPSTTSARLRHGPRQGGPR